MNGHHFVRRESSRGDLPGTDQLINFTDLEAVGKDWFRANESSGSLAGWRWVSISNLARTSARSFSLKWTFLDATVEGAGAVHCLAWLRVKYWYLHTVAEEQSFVVIFGHVSITTCQSAYHSLPRPSQGRPGQPTFLFGVHSEY